jgi:cation diffusion facilitator family transporter
MSRDQIIVRTSFIGIGANVILAAFKAVVGLLSNSIAITLDAVNNLSDALSSVITIIGTKLAGKAPDKKHPYGYGRIEYLSAALISVIVLYAGVTSFVESVKKIIAPETPDYSTASLIIVAAAVVVKIALGRYVKRTGEKVNSESLVDSGQDALMDSVISAATLVAAIIYVAFNVGVEAWLGAVISIVIIRSGVEMLRSTLSQILGERVEPGLAKDIKKTVCAHPAVNGAFDLILNNYGPDTYTGSIHVEVADTMTAAEIDAMTRELMHNVMEKHHVILAAVGIYSLNTQDSAAIEARKAVRRILSRRPEVLQMHGFYLDREANRLSFDVILDFAAADRLGIYRRICEEIQEAFPDYTLHIALDVDASD